MAPKSLAEQIAELEDLTPRDYDPEDLDRGNGDSDEEAGDKDASAGREHYQDVGKAKLRKQDPVALGKQYAGSKVSREALEADSDDDPFAARSSDDDDEDEDEDEEDEDLELGSDEDEGSDSEEEEEEEEEEETRPSKAKKGKKQIEVDDMETDESDELDSEGSFDEMLSDEDDEIPSDEIPSDEESDEDESDHARKPSSSANNDRDELRRLMATDQKTIAATISQAAKADAIKGKAVKQQRATFDALLNTRIKLQKGLSAINQLSLAESTDDLDSEAITSAESAALALWSTLEDLRVALADAQHNPSEEETKKRKRPTPTTSTSTATLWSRMTELESTAHPHRRTILDKWSAKVRNANSNTANTRGKLLASSSTSQQTITAVLDAQVATETGDRAAKRARQDTSSSSTTSSTEGPIYDDTIFYQSLLRDLVEQRMSSSDAITNGLDTLHIQLPSRGGAAVHPVTGMRKDKVKRDVDTRASKGRKMRFDVHEKLQNFMAPEERGSWTKHAREEFFASLLGRSASGLLREEDGEEEELSGGESEEDREEGGLRLFRS
ncbi:AATF family protein [Aspergillus ibericus CBS 121593]|uniref:Protein BFR2 n=1 Tax=Aspergillus ibericus CBS 121593 TaxID=1448316 RepID=A0A395GVV7_9EURO|nr:TRAUB-domain-containing protein [Aspergillus ibericus CBS 121593]RAK98827.1 TRAUB-domain-containing protein [Aspergillus ibericus CBS 121593]